MRGAFAFTGGPNSGHLDFVGHMPGVGGSGGASLAAIVLTQTTAAGTNPPEWDSDFTDYQLWDSATSTGDEHLMRWRRVSGGAWTTEAEQPLDDEMLTGGFTWPLLEAAKPLTGGYFEAQEQRARYVAGIETARAAWSNSVIDTIAAPPASLTPPSTGLLLWNEAGDLSTLKQQIDGTVAVAADGDVIGYQADKSSNVFHMAAKANDTTRPSLLITSSKKFVHYDGVDDYIQRAATLGLYAAGAGKWVVIGFAGRASPGTARTFFGAGRSSNNNPEYHPLASGGGTANRLASLIRNDAGTTTFSNSNNLGALWDGTFRRVIWTDDGANIKSYANGVLVTTIAYTRSGTITVDLTGKGAIPRATPVSFFQADEGAFTAYILNTDPTTGTFLADLDAYLASCIP